MRHLDLVSGFHLGSTIVAETKGIWVWVVDHPRQPGCSLVLLDTEGLGDTNKVSFDRGFYYSKGTIRPGQYLCIWYLAWGCYQFKLPSPCGRHIGSLWFVISWH